MINPATSLENLKRLRGYLQRTELPLSSLALPCVFATLASVFEGITLALLIPTFEALMRPGDVSALSLPSSVQSIFQTELFANHQHAALLVLVGVTFLSAVLKTGFTYLSSIATSFQIRRFAARLRSVLYDRYLTFGKLFYDKNNSGHLQQVLTTYVSLLSHSLGSVQTALYAASATVIYLAMMFSISWQLTLIVLTAFPALHYALRTLIQKIFQTSEAHAAVYNELGRNISNALSSMPLVTAYSNEQFESRRFKQTSEHVSALEYSIEKKSLLVGPIQELILLLFLFAMVLLIGISFVKDDPTALAQYAVYLLILKRAATLFGVFNSIQTALAGVSGPMNEIEVVLQDENKFIVPDGTLHFPGLQGDITLNHLTFSYGPTVSALTDVSLVFKQGEVTALVGESGSGKSTIANLLLRFYDVGPDSILVDGVDIRQFTLASWRKHIAFVSQDTYLFHASLRENLLYGLERDVSDTELNDVLKHARLSAYVSSLPRGLDTQIGDRGVQLSGGERQRVAIARALLKKSEILILDEATSSLDSTTERLIQEAIEELIVGKTTLIIAHRLSTIDRANRIIVLVRGQIVEEGTFATLIEKRGEFYRYWDNQHP